LESRGFLLLQTVAKKYAPLSWAKSLAKRGFEGSKTVEKRTKPGQSRGKRIQKRAIAAVRITVRGGTGGFSGAVPGSEGANAALAELQATRPL
jgi:hypothetical protein